MTRTLAAALLALCTCSNNPKISGEQIGSFTFSATLASNDCPFAAIPDAGFQFDGILSHDPSSSQAYMRVGNVERDAGFDGQYFVSLQSAPRQFAECGPDCDKTKIDETVQVAVLSRTQDEALGRSCPDNPMDGGVPAPDGGVTLPGPNPGGFDAVRVCGELVDVVVPDGGTCLCAGCTMVFQLQGTPKGAAR